MIKFFFFFGQLFVLSFFLVFLVSILLCVTLLVCKQKRPKVHNASYFCKPCVDKKARKVKLKNEKHAHHPPNLILSCFLPAFHLLFFIQQALSPHHTHNEEAKSQQISFFFFSYKIHIPGINKTQFVSTTSSSYPPPCLSICQTITSLSLELMKTTFRRKK